jgi:SAM-dependent methyltransferase
MIHTEDVGKDVRIELALRGTTLYGNDFTDEEIASWFEDEREGYYELYGDKSPSDTTKPEYCYAEVADEHNFRWLPNRDFPSVLGIGSADGTELRPLLSKSETITILEPSDGFSDTSLDGKPVTYVKPVPSGIMPFDNDSFDVIVCFHTLHHIPNVSTVLNEIFRVLKPGGYALLREPTHSMGDWRHPRRGLTRNERGIPPRIFRNIIREAGYQIVREARCGFSLFTRLPHINKRSPWTYRWVIQLDALVCRLPIWSRHYHATHVWQKIRPISIAFVLQKPEPAFDVPTRTFTT